MTPIEDNGMPFGPRVGYEHAYALMRADRLADDAYHASLRLMESTGRFPFLREYMPTIIRVCAECIAQGRTDGRSIEDALTDRLGRREELTVAARLMADRLGVTARDERVEDRRRVPVRGYRHTRRGGRRGDARRLLRGDDVLHIGHKADPCGGIEGGRRAERCRDMSEGRR